MLGLTAEQIGTVLLAVSLLITGRLAQQKGKEIVAKAPAQEGGTLEVAGAIVSDKAAKEWVKAAEKLSEIMDRHAHCLSENTDACRDMSDEITKVGAKIGKLATEMEIARALGDRK